MYINLPLPFPHRPEPFSRDYKGKSPAEISWRAHADAEADVNPNGLPSPVQWHLSIHATSREQAARIKSYVLRLFSSKSEQIDANAY